MKKLSHTYYVYVIEVRSCRGRSCRTVYYVGQSGKTPEERLIEHQRGHRYCRGCTERHYVRGDRMRLRHELFARYNPMTERDRAEAVEKWLASRLRKRGYEVVGGH